MIKSINNKNKGFTLLELIVVIAIIAILAVIGIASYTNSLKKARDARKIEDISNIKKEISNFNALSQVSFYPTGRSASTTGLSISPELNFYVNNGISPTTTLSLIYNEQYKTVPASVKESLIGYAVTGCLTDPDTQPTKIDYNDRCKGYILYTQLESEDNTILKQSNISGLNLIGGVGIDSNLIFAVTN